MILRPCQFFCPLSTMSCFLLKPQEQMTCLRAKLDAKRGLGDCPGQWLELDSEGEGGLETRTQSPRKVWNVGEEEKPVKSGCLVFPKPGH